MTTLIRPARNAEARPGERGRRRLPGARSGLWLWPAAVTLTVVVVGIDGPQLGTDELVTWDVGRRGTGRILALVQDVDAVHAAYYLLMHGWMAVFGDSHLALRLPSALAMSGAAACVALIGARLFGRRAGLCGGLLFALVPAVSRFGQEARGYALVVLAATPATYLLLRALDRPRSGWRWAVAAGAGLAVATRPSSRASEPSEPSGASRSSWLPVAVGLAVLALLVLPDQSRMRGAFEHDVPHAADYAGAARMIEKYHRPGDAVVYVRGAPWMLDQGVRYYLRRDLSLPEVFLAATASENAELYPTHCGRPEACLKGEGRIWVVVPGNGPDALEAVPAPQARALRARYTTYGSEHLSGLTVALLQRKP
ncbi:glycosyltransferase family 39 protein [Streptomyces sp. IBSNAI002]|uniref:glycosyltransferase family 39 protein n=1 Tax=Streptomyces sp. IBSNAI002 TaxID=3457500 RepID=UPI003FD0D0A7